MKNKITVIFLLVLVLSLSACAKPSKTATGSNGPESEEPPTICQIPPQPISFDSIDDAIAFIKAPDLSSYSEEDQEAYRRMVAVLTNDRYLTAVTHSAADRLDDTVVLYPEATYEDIGVHYYFSFNDMLYQVVIYNVKDDCPVDMQTETILDYYVKRWNDASPNAETESTDHTMIPSIVLTETGDGRICVQALIDEGHYVVIRAKRDKVSNSEIVEFVEGLTFGKTLIA